MELHFLTIPVFVLTLFVVRISMLDLGPDLGQEDSIMKYPYLEHYTLVSTYIPTLKSKNNTVRPKRHSLVTDKECHYLSILINATTHTFCIFEERLVENDVAKKDTKIIVHRSSDTQTYQLEDLNITVARGYDVADSDAGSVDGYIEDFRFFGRLIVDSNTYYLEPVRKFPSILKKLKKYENNIASGEAILYEAKDAAFQSAFAANVDRIRLDTIDTNMPSAASHMNLTQPIHLPVKPFSFYKFGSPEIVRGAPVRLCDVALTADHAFYAHHNASVATTVRELLALMAETGAIYRAADINDDGVSDNLGLSVAVVVVVATPRDALAAEFASTEAYLRAFSLTHHGAFCLAVAFTHRNFGDGTLGASWLGNPGPVPPGGICQKPVYHVDTNAAGGRRTLATLESFNTVMVATRMRSGDELPAQMSVLNIAHEIGHSFGSLHDDVQRNKMMCDPEDKYLMAAYSLWGDGVNNAHFSSCSRRRMLRVLNAKGACLREVPHRDAFCGNGLLEGDEECDCGLPLDCQQRDPCCNPRGTYNQCKVNKKFPCHPSQGPCCLPSCQFRDLSYVGLNCSQERQGCPCKGGGGNCTCGLQGMCLGSQCHSAECVRLGLKECTCLSTGGGACATCCRAPNGHCTSSVELTRQQVLSGNLSAASLRRLLPDSATPPAVSVERVCDAAGDCVDATFRTWPHGSFCVSQGRLGHCSALGVCDVSRFRGSEFPRFETVVESRAVVWLPLTILLLFVLLMLVYVA